MGAPALVPRSMASTTGSNVLPLGSFLAMNLIRACSEATCRPQRPRSLSEVAIDARRIQRHVDRSI